MWLLLDALINLFSLYLFIYLFGIIFGPLNCYIYVIVTVGEPFLKLILFILLLLDAVISYSLFLFYLFIYLFGIIFGLLNCYIYTFFNAVESFSSVLTHRIYYCVFEIRLDAWSIYLNSTNICFERFSCSFFFHFRLLLKLPL